MRCSGTRSGASGLLAPAHRSSGPPIDVAYASDPPRAIVTAELGGAQSSDIALQIRGSAG